MTDYMFSSTDKERYNEIVCPINYYGTSSQVEFTVTQLNGNCTIVSVAEGDWITFEDSMAEQTKYVMKTDIISADIGFFEILNSLTENDGITCKQDQCGRYIFSSKNYFEIVDASYRMKQALGLFHEELPLASKEISPNSYELKIQSVGYAMGTPVLMLVSNLGSDNTISDVNSPWNSRSCYVAMKFPNNLTQGQPLNAAGFEKPTRVQASALSNIKLKLVDSNFEPLKVLSPLYVTINVREIHEELAQIEQEMELKDPIPEIHKMREEYIQKQGETLLRKHYELETRTPVGDELRMAPLTSQMI